MKSKFSDIVKISLILLLAAVVMFLLLPKIGNRFVLPEVARKFPFVRSEIHLSKITPWQLEGEAYLGEEEGSTIVLPRFVLRYQPLGLFRREVASLLLESAAIHLERRDSRLSIRGLHYENGAREKEPASLPLALPLAVEKIILRNSTVVIHDGGRDSSYIGLDGTLEFTYRSTAQGKELEALRCVLETGGTLPASITAAAQLGTSRQEASFDLTVADLSAAAALLPKVGGAEYGGRLNLSGKLLVEGSTGPPNYSVRAEFAPFRMSANKVVLASEDEQSPIVLELEGKGKKLRYRMHGAMLTNPERAIISMAGDYDMLLGKLQGSGRITGDRFGNPLSVEYQGSLSGQTADLSYRLSGDSLTLGQDLAVRNYDGQGDLRIGQATLSGTLSGKISEITESKSGVSLRSVGFDLPFMFPVEQDEKRSGTFAIDTIRYKNVDSAGLRASLTLGGGAISIDASLTSPLDPDFTCTCEADVTGFGDLALGCRVAELDVDSAALKPYLELPETLFLSGKVTGVLDLSWRDADITGKAEISYRNGTLTFGDYSLAGIDADLSFPDLPRIGSSAGQRITVGAIDLGKIKMSDAKIDLRIDDLQTLFIERAVLGWCNGRVEAGGFRVYREMEKLQTTFYCDRLEFTKLLAQFGIGDAQGEGSLNGRLPVVISKEGIVFDDGFLFSTPGKGGIVRFRDTGQLRQGMEGMGKSTYLEYSLDALENFLYNWTRLTFDTEQEQLLLSLQLDGKPAEPIPYAFRQSGIVADPGGEGIQYPLRIDVNFRLPLSDLFRYGKNIQSIMEKM